MTRIDVIELRALMKINQYFIFLITFLVVSLLINLFLFIDLTDADEKLIVLTKNNQRITSELEMNSSTNKEQQQKVNQMMDHQAAVSSVISELRTQLDELNDKYKNTVVTSNQTKAMLNSAASKINSLEKSFKEQAYIISESKKTIQNQQRLLRTTLSDTTSVANQNIQEQLAELSVKLANEGLSEIISVAQKTNGQNIVAIPLDLLFVDNELTLKLSATNTLKIISETLSSIENPQITVIGHSDPRPITSDLALLYPTNWELSSVRASKIVQRLIEYGVSENTLTAAGKASSMPVRNEAIESAWRINRRIEIRIEP